MVRVRPPLATAERSTQPIKRQRVASLPTSGDLWVQSLPGLDSLKTTLFAGNLPAAPPSVDTDAHLYFLLARNKHIPNRQRLVIWFNGGPGCSSFDGALVEIGPYRINANGTVREVEKGAWNEYANVIFLDQPAGTGFSYVTKNDNVRELGEAADQVVAFLANLYQIFPEYATMDTYLAGESYAGQYIPYIAAAIQRSRAVETPLKGLLIGDGWISPRAQYPAYLDYLVENKFLRKGTQGYRNVLAAVTKCEKKMDEMEQKGNDGKGTVLVGECEEILGVMSAATMKDGLCLNSYDTSEYHACGTEWPPDVAHVTKYLRRKEVVKALHGEGATRPWSQCDNTVGSHFWTPKSVPSIQLLPELLETIPILLYAGDKDLMCAGLGIEKAIEGMEWNGLRGFNGSDALDWTVDGVPAGRWTSRANLTYVEVKNSSHMVPMDQPLAAHDMLLRFMAVDTLGSAGPAARIPSRVGLLEPETVLGSTQPNGSSLLVAADGTLLSSNPILGGNVDGNKELDSTLGQGIDGIAGGGTDKAGLGTTFEDGFDINHERYYGPRRTAALVFVLIVVAGLGWIGLRWRRRERLRRRMGGSKGSGPRWKSGRGGGGKAKGKAIRLEETGYTSTSSRDYEDDDRSSRREGSMASSSASKRRETEDVETVRVFDVGDDDTDEEDEEQDEDAWGDLGRQAEVWADDDAEGGGSEGRGDEEKGFATTTR